VITRQIIILIAFTLAISTMAPQFSSTILSNPPDILTEARAGYYINGSVYLYNGNGAGVYQPLVSGSGTMVYVRWFDTGMGSNRTVTTATNAIGQFSAEISNFTDGSIVELKAQFGAPYSNWGYNYTMIDEIMHPSGMTQDIVCGVPYEVVYNPIPPATVIAGTACVVSYQFLDRDGAVCQGYYTFNDGNMNFHSNDPLFQNDWNHPLRFDGIGGSVTDGYYSGSVVFFSAGENYLNISEGGQSEMNPYLTPWGDFSQSIDFSFVKGWSDDWETSIVFCLGGARIWWNLRYGWNLLSLPLNPRSFQYGSNGIFDSFDALNLIYASNADLNLRMLKRLPGVQPTFAVFDYGQPESAAFAMDGVHSYWVWTEAAAYVMFYGQDWAAPANTIVLNIGWNALGFPHQYPYWDQIPTASDFTDGTIDADLDIAGSNQKIIASQWNAVTQKFISYVVTDSFPGIQSKNWQWDFSEFSFPGNGLMLWTDEADQITFPMTFSEAPGNGICSGQTQPPEPLAIEEQKAIRATSRDVPPGDPYPVYGYIIDNYMCGPGYDVHVEWTDQSGSVIPATPLHEATNNYGQYSADLYNHVGGSVVWENATKTGFSGHNSTVVNMTENAGKRVDIWNDATAMSLTKVGPASVNPGDNMVYTLSYQNIGQSTAYNVVITDIYPAGVSFVSSVPAPSAGNNVWNLGSIPAGGSGMITITVAVSPLASRALVNNASLTFKNIVAVPQPPVNDSCTTVVFSDPFMTISKTGPATANPGQSITYTITCENLGTDMAYNVVITDMLPTGVTFISAVPLPTSILGQVITWDIGTIPVASTYMIQLTVQVEGPTGSLVNYVELTYEDSGGNPQPTVNDTCVTMIINPLMMITKSGPATASPGDTIAYWLNYTNNGTDWAYNVWINETYPVGVTFISAIPVPSIGDNVWFIGAVAPGASGSIMIAVQVNAGATGNITNFAQLDYWNSAMPLPPVTASCVTSINPSTGPVHNLDTDEYFNAIQAAIDDPDTLNGHTIEVSAGTYYEHVLVNKMLTIKGAGQNVCTMDGSGIGNVVYISANWVNITGFTITNSGSDPFYAGIELDSVQDCCIEDSNISGNGYSGIFLYYSNHNNLSNNIVSSNNGSGYNLYASSSNIITDNSVSNNHEGIYLWTSNSNVVTNNIVNLNKGIGFNIRYSSINTITNNTIYSNNGIGILLFSSSSNIITNNTISYNGFGIFISSSNSNTFTNNKMIDNGFYFWGQTTSNWDSHSIDTSNTVNGKPVYYWKNQNGGTIPLYAGQIILANSINVIVENQFFIEEGSDIILGFSSSNTIVNNTVNPHDDNGIFLYLSNGNTIVDNAFSNNGHGIHLWSSDSNILRNNNVLNNTYGIYIEFGSNNNLIYHNNIKNNILQAYDDTSTNTWDNGYPSGGNYWSDYMGSDVFSGSGQNETGSDGIGDTPYIIDVNSQDNYPLMESWVTPDGQPPNHFNEYPPISGSSFNLTPVISVDVTDISGVNASTIRLYVGGFMIFYNLAAIPGGYTASYWHEGGFTEGQVIPCRIIAKDYLGNTLDFTWTFTATIGESFNISLHLGWNLLSFPLVPIDSNIEELFSSISGNWDVAKWFDPNDPTDPWKTYRVGGPANDLTHIDNTMGFWLHVTNSSQDLVIYGNAPVTTNILLKAGWNLVSYPCQTDKTVATALWGTGADRVEAYDGSSPTLLRELGPGELMGSGNGYWVHVPTDSVWTVSY